jgi:hypothetical protein
MFVYLVGGNIPYETCDSKCYWKPQDKRIPRQIIGIEIEIPQMQYQ